MGFLTSHKFYTVLLSFLTQVPTYEGRINDHFQSDLDASNCCLCEGCESPAHPDHKLDYWGLTCAQLDHEMIIFGGLLD
ncbi:MAG: hypothetical protein AB8G05_27160 [Oligoflexales bacterium]